MQVSHQENYHFSKYMRKVSYLPRYQTNIEMPFESPPYSAPTLMSAYSSLAYLSLSAQ